MDAGAFIADPAWTPHRYDAAQDTLAFARLPRETQRALPFLDPRYVKPELVSAPIPVSALQTFADALSTPPLHFIFHTAFCGSTLLTRALDAPGVSMGLKEPSVLVDIAAAWRREGATPKLDAVLATTLRLLARPFAPGEI